MGSTGRAVLKRWQTLAPHTLALVSLVVLFSSVSIFCPEVEPLVLAASWDHSDPTPNSDISSLCSDDQPTPDSLSLPPQIEGEYCALIESASIPAPVDIAPRGLSPPAPLLLC